MPARPCQDASGSHHNPPRHHHGSSSVRRDPQLPRRNRYLLGSGLETKSELEVSASHEGFNARLTNINTFVIDTKHTILSDRSKRMKAVFLNNSSIYFCSSRTQDVNATGKKDVQHILTF